MTSRRWLQNVFAKIGFLSDSWLFRLQKSVWFQSRWAKKKNKKKQISAGSLIAAKEETASLGRCNKLKAHTHLREKGWNKPLEPPAPPRQTQLTKDCTMCSILPPGPVKHNETIPTQRRRKGFFWAGKKQGWVKHTSST